MSIRKANSLLAVPVALAVLTGCIKSKVAVHVNPDGSGHIVVSRLFDAATVHDVEVAAATDHIVPDGDMDAGALLARIGRGVTASQEQADVFFDEKALRREAAAYGPGVKFVKARRLDMAGGRGSIAVYSFKDINDVYIAPDVDRMRGALYGGANAAMGVDDDEGDVRGRTRRPGVEFSFRTGAVSRLKILMPVPEEDGDDEDAEEEDGDAGEKDDPSDEASEWFGAGAYGGMGDRLARSCAPVCTCGACEQPAAIALGLDVFVRGKIVSTTAARRDRADSNRIVLLDFDSTRQEKKNGDADDGDDLSACNDAADLIKAVRRQPGSTVETNREIVVEFR